jgi:hypothetical protein
LYDSPDEDEAEPSTHGASREYIFIGATMDDARAALKDIGLILRPPRNKGAGYKKCTVDLLTRTRLEGMQSFLHIYTNTKRPIGGRDADSPRWIAASLEAANAAQRGPWFARKLREWARAFILDREDIPRNRYGTWNKERSILEQEDVAEEIALHLQSMGKYVKALDIVHYIDQPEVKK